MPPYLLNNLYLSIYLSIYIYIYIYIQRERERERERERKSVTSSENLIINAHTDIYLVLVSMETVENRFYYSENLKPNSQFI